MKFVSIFDSIKDNKAVIDPNHPKITNSEQRSKLLKYLKSGKLIMAATYLSEDILDPQKSNKVPATFFTDGTYIWPGSAIYYLENYGLAPNDDFLVYFNALNTDVVGEVSDEQVKTALHTMRNL